ncbi:MAG TPA: NAD(+)/NADH kinase [Asanoa sp.]|nr:NAD(+)/NADH kinase [Asanoa sp.]
MLIGVVVNPVAGMGGRVGLHGTDGPDAYAEALRRGATPVAPDRARRALDRLRSLAPDAEVLEASRTDGSSADDTIAGVRDLVAKGAGLILFAGGDGTARDVASAGVAVPVLGIPAGVKMHSGVFAATPELAGETAARFLADPARVVDAEVVDRDPGGNMVLHGVLPVPAAGAALQRAKTAQSIMDAALPGLGREVAAELKPHKLYLLGPGTTVAHVSHALGLPYSPLGVDVTYEGRLLALDASEQELLSLIGEHGAPGLILGVVGGQGFLLGRGNQQLSPAVLAAADDLRILAAAGKVAALDPPVLRVDLDSVGERFTGYHKVRTARGRSTVLRIVEGA